MVEAATFERLMAPYVDPTWPAAEHADLFYPEPGPGADYLRSDAIIIGLSDADIADAREEGEWRARRALEKKTRQRYGAGERFASEADRIELDVQAAGAELAVARAFRMRWTGLRHAEPYDVGGGIEVRYRRADPAHPDYLDLWIRPSDGREKPGPYVLVTGELGVYIVRGWIHVPRDLRPAWLVEHATRPGSKAYVVPRAALRSLRALPGRNR